MGATTGVGVAGTTAGGQGECDYCSDALGYFLLVVVTCGGRGYVACAQPEVFKPERCGGVAPKTGGHGDGFPVTPGVRVAGAAGAFGSATPREGDDDAPTTPYTFVSLLRGGHGVAPVLDRAVLI